jgi:hypothetical protein
MSLRDHVSRFADSDAGLSIILAIQITIIFVVAPLAASGAASVQWVEMLRFGLAATAILIVARTTRAKAAIAVLFAATWLASLHWPLGPAPHPLAQPIAVAKIVVTLAFDLIVVAVVAGAAFGPGKVTVHRILGAIILYLDVALVFANLYRLLVVARPLAFAGLPADPNARFSELVWFSLSSLTTSGTGALAPLHPLARSLSSLEAVIGQLYPATILGRLVTLHASTES